MAAPTKPCKDCVTTGIRLVRPAPYPGPRCATHHREFKKVQKAKNHDTAVVRTYGLAPGEYELLYGMQQGVCAVCRRANGTTKRLAVDHNHFTGKVRGLLCGPCNQFVGYLRNAPAAFLRAAVYLCEGDLDMLASLIDQLDEQVSRVEDK